jgi:hypothetical protein
LDDEDMTASDALECHTDDGRCSGAGLDERRGMRWVIDWDEAKDR